MTEPELPVAHGTTLILNCLGGYTNLGGNTATCLYGQVVPTNGSPACRGINYTDYCVGIHLEYIENTTLQTNCTSNKLTGIFYH